MAQSTAIKPFFLKAFHREATPRPPVWFMRQAGRYMKEYRNIREKYSILEICKNPELACEVTLQPVRKLGVDAAIIFADILLPMEPMGIQFSFSKGEGPSIQNPIRQASDIEQLKIIDPKEDLKSTLKALKLVRQELSPETALIGFAGAPFTLASYLIEGGHSDHYLKTKAMMHQQPDLWKKLMEKLTRVTSDYLLAQANAGAQVVQLFDSWAGALNADDYRKFVFPYSQSIFERLRSSGIPSIHFSTGTAEFLDLIREAGGNVIGIDWRISLKKAWEIIGHNVGIQGNLDPSCLLAPIPAIRSQIQDILEQAEGRPGHVFNLGHGVLPETPEENLKLVVEEVKKWRQ
ncbi:MAG: uroporphyrinogen decarboxylase [Elusimicrobia bacterium]|nr:uroporphyrinogen decarboxylase [Elusimicrobiota bacterium]